MTKQQAMDLREIVNSIESAARDLGRYEYESDPPIGYERYAREGLTEAWEAYDTFMQDLPKE